jgi:PAS domain S-box-containing protein
LAWIILKDSTRLGRYISALATVGIALAIRMALNPLLGARFPLLTVTVAIIFSARYFGSGPSIVGTIAGAIAGSFLFDGGRLSSSSESLGLVPYLVASFLVIWMMEALRQSRRHAEERLAQLRAESARREREQRFAAQLRAIVESSDDAIASIDLNGNIASWNRAAEDMFGYTAEEAIGKPISTLTPAERVREEAGMIALIQCGSRVKTLETVRKRRDGSQIQVALTISPIHHDDGSVGGVSYIARDITERKEFDQRLTQTQKLESLGVLAGGLAHDFNNLLTGIMGNASLALQMRTPEGAQERIAEVLRASERAALLVSQMLAYAGKGAFILEQVDLSQQVREIVPLIRASIARAVEFDLQLTEGLPRIEGDRSQMQQLVMNLIMNAVEAIGDRPGTVAIVTTAIASGGGRQVVFEVADNGCGMDEATKALIFDPFFTTKFTGRGLGLAAALGIIGALHGEISVESAPGQGSVFRVVFPVSEDPVHRAAALPA